MILRSSSSLELNLRAAQKPLSPRCTYGARMITTISASSRNGIGGKMIPRTFSEGSLDKMRAISASDSASSKVLEGFRLHQGGFGSNGGLGGRDGDGTGGGGDGGGGSVDQYYEEMIQRFPDDALILTNYARFLKEVKGDGIKAEEYCERAILSENGRDGDLLSMYGDLIWKNHGDGVRAHSYFDQAVQSSPQDCHVLASYARFLWDAEEDDEEEESKKYSSDFSTYNNNNQSVSVLS